jgi:hypothetical protein
VRINCAGKKEGGSPHAENGTTNNGLKRKREALNKDDTPTPTAAQNRDGDDTPTPTASSSSSSTKKRKSSTPPPSKDNEEKSKLQGTDKIITKHVKELTPRSNIPLPFPCCRTVDNYKRLNRVQEGAYGVVRIL